MYDIGFMSMSEIQEAAEIITSAVSPDANIIFGATLKADLEDELIITVIATGFDSAYFHEQADESEAKKAESVNSILTDETVGNINLDLDHNEAASMFAEENTQNIWNQPEEDEESEMPAFLRRRKKNKKEE